MLGLGQAQRGLGTDRTGLAGVGDIEMATARRKHDVLKHGQRASKFEGSESKYNARLSRAAAQEDKRVRLQYLL